MVRFLSFACLFSLSALLGCNTPKPAPEAAGGFAMTSPDSLQSLLLLEGPISEKKLDSIAQQLHAFEQQSPWPENLDNLYRELGWKYFHKNSYSSAFLNFSKSCEVAQSQNDNTAWAYGLLAVAQLHHALGNYDEAIQHAKEGLEIAKKLKDNVLLHLAYQRHIQIDFEHRNYQLASQSANEAIEAFRNTAPENLIHFYNVLGLIDLHLNRWQAAKARFFESLEAAKSRPETDKGFLYGNLGTAYFKLGMLDSARYFMGADLKWSLLQGYKQSAFNAAIGLMEIMAEGKTLDSPQALHLLHVADSLQQLNDVASKHSDDQIRLQLIKRLPQTEKLVQMEKLLNWLSIESFQNRTNARQERKNIHDLSETASKLTIAKSQTAFAEKTRNFLFLAVASLLALFILTIALIRKKYATKLTEHKLLQGKYEHLQEEFAAVQSKVALGQHELDTIREMNSRLNLERSYMQAQNEQAMINQAYLLTTKQKTIDKLVQMLENQPAPAEQNRRMVQLALNELQQLEQAAIHLSPVHGKVNPDFENFVHATYPELTSDEIKHLMYIRMNMSTSEIARIKSITVAGVNKSRNRMRKKLGLQPSDDLRDFVMSL